MRANARAVTEYCPAQLEVAQVNPASDGASSDYVFALRALQQRDVVATATVQTSEGWYTLAIPTTSIIKRTEIEPGRITLFASDRQIMRFPTAVHVLAAWITSAQGVDCKAVNYVKGPKSAASPRPSHFDPPIAEANPANALQVTPIAAPTLACEKPFANATVTRAAQPYTPASVMAMGPETALVYVAVGPNNKVDDAWIFASTGNKWYDDAAVQSAKQSSYESARLLCDRAPGMYIFRVTFDPD